MQTVSASTLISVTRTAFIIAHKEDTSQLESTLQSQGFSVKVFRGPYTEAQLKSSTSVRCLINHSHAWRAVAESKSPAIVVEADFVPVSDFAHCRSPLPETNDDPTVGFSWLYPAGSILYGFDRYGHPHGHGNTMVAYLLKPNAAQALVVFAERELRQHDPSSYSCWDTYLGIYLRKEVGILNHIPSRCFGEYGGLPQPEHARAGFRAWHQADVLMGTLAFDPLYARRGLAWACFIRTRARLRGWYRLASLRFFDPRYVNSDTTKGRMTMALFSVRRLLKI